MHSTGDPAWKIDQSRVKLQRRLTIIGALDCAARKLIVNTSATKCSSDFIAFLGRLDASYRPCPALQNKPVDLALDNGPIHTSKASRAALSIRDWLTVEWLPKYAPELNDIERSWRDLQAHFLAHQTFAQRRSSRPRYP